MFKATLALCLSLVFAGLGNILLSKGMRTIGPLEHFDLSFLTHYFIEAISNPWIILGILMELAYFLCWLVVLSWADVSWGLPMHAIEYIFVAVLAGSLLGERITFSRWIAIGLITLGVVFMMKSWNHEGDEDEPNEDEYPAG